MLPAIPPPKPLEVARPVAAASRSHDLAQQSRHPDLAGGAVRLAVWREWGAARFSLNLFLTPPSSKDPIPARVGPT